MTNQKNFFLGLLGLLCYLDCISQESYVLQLDSLVMYNLEEDKKGQEKGDEIILIYGFYDYEQDSLLSVANSSILIFNDSLTSNIVADTCKTNNENAYFFITLLEIDTDLQQDSLQQKVIDAYLENNHFPGSLLQSNMNFAMGDDDLLQLNEFTIEEILEMESILWKGLHAFNKYSYQLFLQSSEVSGTEE